MQLIYSYALPCRAMPASPVAWDLLLVERNVVRCFPIPTHAHVALASLALPRSKCRDWINHLVMPNPVSLLTQWSGYSGIKSVAAIGCLLCYLFSCPLDQWCNRNVFFDLYWTFLMYKSNILSHCYILWYNHEAQNITRRYPPLHAPSSLSASCSFTCLDMRIDLCLQTTLQQKKLRRAITCNFPSIICHTLPNQTRKIQIGLAGGSIVANLTNKINSVQKR